MAVVAELKQTFSEWIAAVTNAVETAAEKFVRVRRIKLDEAEDGTFSAKAMPGSKAIPGKRPRYCPICLFVSRTAGLNRRCLRSGKPRSAVAVLRRSCGPTMS